ncbi:MAG: 4a-hydroxytetrahydrobiopterin dehydratase [Acidimicrobiales bacterium]
MTRLTDDEVSQALAKLDGWSVVDGMVVRELRFPSFRDAVAFVVRLSYEAEAADHHPDLDIRYNRVRVALSTHSEGGITPKDLALARTIQHLAG